MVDGRERELRDRTHPTLTSERDRDRADRERDMSLPVRDREHEWGSPREQPRRKPQPTGPGIPPLAGPGTGAPPPLGPGVPPMVGPGIPDDPHKISTTSAPGSSGPSRAHSRSQLSKDDMLEHGKDMERGPRIPERDLPPTGPGRTPDYPPPRDYPYRREPGEIPAPMPPSRRDREEYTGPGGPVGSSRLPPPPADYRTSSEYGREPPPPADYRREPAEYRRPVDLREPPPPQRGEYRREPPPADYRRDPPPPTEYRRDAPPPVEYRRELPPAEYRDHRREPYPPADYRREPPPPGDYRRDPHPPDYRTPVDYRDTRRDLQPPPGSGHSPEVYRREPEYRREREPQDYPSSRRNSNEHRRDRDRMIIERDMMREREREADLRRGDPGSGPGIPPGERQPRRSPHQTRDMDRDPYLRRSEDYRREPPPGQVPHDYRGPPPPEPYRPDYRPPPGEHRREHLPPPSDYPPRRDHHPHPQDYRRDEYPRQPSHSHGPPGPPPPPVHPGQEMRGPPPPGPPVDYRGPPGDYRRDVPPGPPQEYRRDVPPPADYRGPPGSLPPPGDYPPRQGLPPHSSDYRGREPGEAATGSGGREYPRREREREPHPRDSGEYSRPPPGDYPPPRRREEGGDHMSRTAPQPSSIPPGPGVPGRTATPNSEVYVVKHPSDRERDRERDRWERDQRERERERGERGHYPPSQPPSGSGGPPPPHVNVPQLNHSHSHPKTHPHHHAHHHHHVIHSHPHGAMHPGGPPPPPSSGGPPGGPSGSGSGGQGGPPPPPPSQGGTSQQQPSQRQLQSQFPTRFVSVNTHPGSRMGSPVPGGPPGPGVIVGPGGSASGGPGSVRKDMAGGSGNVNAGKDMKKMSRSGGPPGGPPVPGSGGRRDVRDEREMKEREIHPPYSQQPPPGQSIPHREQGRVLGHGYPHSTAHGGPQGPHGPPYGEDAYMVVDDMEREHREREQHMQMQNQHPPPHPHPHAHPHAHPHVRPSMLPQSMVQHPHQQQQQHPLAPQIGYYPGPQEPSVEELWGPPQEQPDREVKSRHKINLGTFVFPNTPFPYYFDVGEWVGVNGGNGAPKDTTGKAEEVKGGEVENEKAGEKQETEKEKNVEAEKMDVDGDGENAKKAREKEKETDVVEAQEKEGEKEKEQEQEKEKEKPVEVEKTASQKEDVDDMLDVETRATILIPNGYIPREKPLKPALWGGGVIGRPISPQRRPSLSTKDDKPESPVRPRKRRIYTDDSDLFLCALHSGWLTWSGSARARDKGQDLRVEVRIIRCAGAGAGSVYAVGAGAHAGKYAPAVNSVVATNGAYHKKNGHGKSTVMRKEELVGRFIGGWGEKCFVKKDTDTETEDETDNDEDNDGRGLVSAGWGSGHDGSAIEVLKAEFVNKSTARAAPGLGRRNRAQRLLEYNERRAAVLGLQRLSAPTRLAGKKRRRNVGGWMSEDETTEDEQVAKPSEPEKQEEAQLMAVRTVMFGTGLAGDIRLGYKYEPAILKDILFPAPSGSTTDRPPARKRRRTTIASADILMEDPEESEPPPPTPNRPVILETVKESYLLSLAHGSEFSLEGRKYDISLILEGEVEEDREDAVVLVVADKNAVKAVETPPPSPPADEDEDEEPKEAKPPSSPDVAMDSANATKPSRDENARDTLPSRPASPASTVPRDDTQPTNTDSSKADTTAESLSTTKTAATVPPPSAEDVSMVDAPAPQPAVDKHEPPTKPVKKLKHPVAQVLQRRVGENMFKFSDEGISIADGEDGMPTEWLVQVKSWKWATRKVVRV